MWIFMNFLVMAKEALNAEVPLRERLRKRDERRTDREEWLHSEQSYSLQKTNDHFDNYHFIFSLEILLQFTNSSYQ